MTKSELNKFYNKYVNLVYRYFYYKTELKEISEDLTSQTFLLFIEVLNKEQEINDYKSYLFGIAKHLFIKYVKEKSNFILMIDEEIYEEKIPTEDEYEENIYQRKLPSLIQKLPESQRVVMNLLYLERMSIKEVAKHLKRNIDYVKTNRKRAIKSIRKIIQCTPSNT